MSTVHSRADGGGARLPEVRLRKPLAERLRQGHPWLFRDAIAAPPLPTGTVVDVIDPRGGFLARGLYDAESPIAVRIYTRERGEALDQALVHRRVAAALAARRGVIDARETDAFRWLNGEGDRLPGVVVDLYRDVAVLKFDGRAAETLREAVTSALVALGAPLALRHIVERQGAGTALPRHGGPPPVPVEIKESGVRFAVDVVHGQKTGTFLDQRENRRALRRFADGARVVNLFAYSGGFSVHAALAGARHVTSVDSAAAALDAARDNFARNRLDPDRHAFVRADAFRWLDEARLAGERFDLVIVDPPSFAPSERARPRALAAYRDLHAAALAVLSPGGIFATSSCSSHVAMEPFLESLAQGAAKAGRTLQLLELHGQPGDHPSLPGFPEGRYLKFVIARAAD